MGRGGLLLLAVVVGTAPEGAFETCAAACAIERRKVKRLSVV